MTAPQEAGDSGSELWLDMSRYPDTDPDAVLSPDQHNLLTDALAVDDTALPDAVFEHMLAVVTGDTTDDDHSDATDPEGDVGVDDDVLAVDDAEQTWSEDLAHAFGLDPDPAADPAIDDPTHEPHPATDPGHDGHGGWV